MGLTRGNGEQGSDVTHLMRMLIGAPIKNRYRLDEVVLNGECVTDNNVENFRNYVAGALGLESPHEFAERNIKFIAHDWLGVNMDYTTRMKIVKNMGFFTVLEDESWNYPQDGVVYRARLYANKA